MGELQTAWRKESVGKTIKYGEEKVKITWHFLLLFCDGFQFLSNYSYDLFISASLFLRIDSKTALKLLFTFFIIL